MKTIEKIIEEGAIREVRRAYRKFLNAHSDEEISKSYKLKAEMRRLERDLTFLTSTLPELPKEVSK